jgi:TM2 domain-containing membrane protein YozV
MSALLEADEEALARRVEMLGDAERKRYFELATESFKDPDLYAALAYGFITGLHHFYLGKWERGLVDLGFNVVGISAIVIGAVADSLWFVLGGVTMVGIVAIAEVGHLFKSQEIVRRHNLEKQYEILAQLSGRSPL